MQGMRIWSLVRELGAYMLCGAVKKKKKKITGTIQWQQQNQTDLKMNKGLE